MRARLFLLAFALITTTMGLTASTGAAATTRLFQSSLNSGNPISSSTLIAVDQSNGDVYAAVNSLGAVARFDSSGAPKNFTAGPGAGTNKLVTGLSAPSVAIDNSGGPLDGTIYVSNDPCTACVPHGVQVFAPSGASLGALGGSGNEFGKFRSVCGIAVDQADGSLFVAEPLSQEASGRVWRYAPTSPSGSIDDSDYLITGAIINAACSMAADSGTVYVASNSPTGGGGGVDLHRYLASQFTASAQLLSGTGIATGAGAVKGVALDHKNGDLYVYKANHAIALDSADNQLYTFGFRAYMNSESGLAGIAVKSAASGAAAKVYVDHSEFSSGLISVFGGVTQAPVFTTPELTDFGPDGTSATSFSSPFFFSANRELAFDQAARRLYVADSGPPGIYGLDAASPPAFPPLAAFSPLSTAAPGDTPGLAVDNSGLGSAGNIYLASESTDLLYGFNSAGTPLGGAFPIDPATSPGAPDGSPKDLCGAAVDAAGNVWVSNAAGKRILKYSSAGVSLGGSVDTSAQGVPCKLALDTNGDLYVGMKDGSVWSYTAASGYGAATRLSYLGSKAGNRGARALAVDPTTHRLYVANADWVDMFDSSGTLLAEFDAAASNDTKMGIAVDPANHHVYISERESRKIQAFGASLLFPEVAASPPTSVANTSATLRGQVGPQGLAVTDCHFEYVTEAAYRVGGLADLSSGGSVPCSPAAGSIPADLDQHSVSATISALSENTEYHYRLSVANVDGETSAEGAFSTDGPPIVETVGSPVRTTTTAQLGGRLFPHGVSTTYHFEYGTDGPCDSNPCEATASQPGGAGNRIELVSQEVEGLEPGITYHYRIVADSGNSDGPAFGEDMTVTTRASDEPLSHGHFPGPPGSDRAYELVSIPNSGGNPVFAALGFAEDGNRALYQISGGTPVSSTGNFISFYFSERAESAAHEGSWQTRFVSPARSEIAGSVWDVLSFPADLSSVAAENSSETKANFWLLRPDAGAQKLFEPSPQQKPSVGGLKLVATKSPRTILTLEGVELDPGFPEAEGVRNLYDVTSGTPRLLSLLPDGTPPTCGVGGQSNFFLVSREANPLAPDGSRVFFATSGNNCGSNAELYLREIEAEETKRVSGPPISGGSCGASLIKANADVAYFWTKSRLAAEDTAPGSCQSEGSADGDIYRYDIATEALRCLTCVVAGLNADVYTQTGSGGSPRQSIAISEDGSRVYFQSPHALLPGVPVTASAGSLYVVEVKTGELRWVAGPGVELGEVRESGSAISYDGSTIRFRANDPSLNPVGGTSNNGGTRQYYRYDDRDRSLLCVSCPQDGSASLADAAQSNGFDIALTDTGDLVFATPTALVAADQNTVGPGQDPKSGTDVYEWRDGRLFLITDGLTNWPIGQTGVEGPKAVGITRSGRDVFFIAPTQYTPDALDGYARVYDARVGGGFNFPKPPPPCPLEVCQGTPKGAPEEQAPGTGAFQGLGNAQPRKHKTKKHHHKKRHQAKRPHRANHNRRASR